MDLEIADYERTVNSLQVQLSNKDEKIAELQNEVTHYEERTKTLQKEIGQKLCLYFHIFLINVNSVLSRSFGFSFSKHNIYK